MLFSKEEFSEIYNKGYDHIMETPYYSNEKIALCRKRRRILGATENPSDANEMTFKVDV